MKYASYLVKHIIEDASLDIEDKKRLAYEILNQALETGELNLNQIEHNEGFTHLIAAVDFDDAITVEWLLDHDQNINVATRNGITALHEAARDGRAEIMQILLERGANPNARIL